jgi:hypothetical protein
MPLSRTNFFITQKHEIGRAEMKYVGIVMILFASFCCANKRPIIFSLLQPTCGELSIRGLTVPGEYRFA